MNDKQNQRQQPIKNQPKANDFDKEKNAAGINENTRNDDNKTEEEKEVLSKQKDSD